PPAPPAPEPVAFITQPAPIADIPQLELTPPPPAAPPPPPMQTTQEVSTPAGPISVLTEAPVAAPPPPVEELPRGPVEPPVPPPPKVGDKIGFIQLPTRPAPRPAPGAPMRP